MIASGAKAVHLTSASVLSEILAISFVKLLFKEGEVFHYGGAVTDIALTHAFHLRRVLLTLIIFDYIFCFHSELAAEIMKVSVASIHMNAYLLPLTFQFFQLSVDLIVRSYLDVLAVEILRNGRHSVSIRVDCKSVL